MLHGGTCTIKTHTHTLKHTFSKMLIQERQIVKQYKKHAQFLDDEVFFPGLECVYQLKDVWVVDPGTTQRIHRL